MLRQRLQVRLEHARRDLGQREVRELRVEEVLADDVPRSLSRGGTVHVGLEPPAKELAERAATIFGRQRLEAEALTFGTKLELGGHALGFRLRAR
ncbi:MAG TPA: hypothetical protein VFQ35_24840 [Polyangiaceae bacterium]|nr:hypothetical protein [Polyangiaceae bacterium]